MPSIDQRVVQMEFENKQFEKGVAESLKSLEALKKGLDLDKSANSLANLEKIASHLDLSGIADGVNKISSKFSLLGMVGVTAMQRVSNAVVDAGTKFAKMAIGVDEVRAGMSKYETQTKAVQTITNATGKSVAEVESVLATLMKYTDETSYDFSTMVSTIGKFTASGVDLKVAEQAMEGIANEAAKSGAGIQEANRAMYNFAQALSTGAVKLMDWKSIENANMATKEFKEQLIETAIEAGTLTKSGDKVGKIMKGTGKKAKATTVDFKSFNSTLQEGWLTSDVLLKTLQKYSDTSTQFGLDAFHAAQEALTFTDALNAMKDAVSSGWMQSFKLIFGDLDEARLLWTNVANGLYDYVAIFMEYRNEQLKAWHDHGGYIAAIEAGTNIWETFMTVLEGIREVFTDIFPPITGDRLVEITEKVRDATAEWKALFGLDEGEVEIDKPIKTMIDDTKYLIGNLKTGMSGEEVRKLQDQLINAGFKLDRYHADGIYGPETEKAVKELQKALGLEQTGYFDSMTKEAASAAKMFTHVEETTEKVKLHVGDTYEVEKKHLELIDEAVNLNKTLGEGLVQNEDDVKELQKALVRTGYLEDGSFASGIYGKETEEAVKKLQEELGVKVTGTWDKATREATISAKTFEHNEVVFSTITKTVGQLTPGMEKLQNIMRGLFAAGDLLFKTVKFGFDVVTHFFSLFSPLLSVGANVLELIAGLVTNFRDGVDQSNVFGSALEKVKAFLKPFGDAIQGVADRINTFIEDNKWVTTFEQLFFVLGNEMRKNPFLSGLLDLGNKIKMAVQPVIAFFTDFKNAVTTLFNRFKRSGKPFDEFFAGLKHFKPKNNATKVLYALVSAFLKVREGVKKAYPIVVDFLKKVADCAGNSIKRAFEWIGTSIPKIAKAIGDFVSKIVNSVRTSDKFRAAWEKVKTFFSEFGKAIAEFGKGAFNGLKNFFTAGGSSSFVDNFKNKWGQLRDTIAKIKADIKKKISELARENPVIYKIVAGIDRFINGFKTFLAQMKESITGFFDADTEGIESPLDKIKKRLEAFKPIVDYFIDLKDKFVNAFNELFSGGNKNGKTVDAEKTAGTSLSFFDRISEYLSKFKGFNFEKLIGPAIGAIGVFSLLKILSTVKNLSSGFKSIGEGFFLKMGGKQKDGVGDTVMKIGEAIGMIALSVALLSVIDAEKAKKSLGVFEIVLGSVAGVMFALSKFGGEGGNDVGKQALMLAGSIGVIALSLLLMTKIVSKTDPGTLAASIGIIAALIVGLGVISYKVSKVSNGGITKGLDPVLQMCMGLGIIALAFGKVVKIVKKNAESPGVIVGSFGIIELLLITLGAIEILLTKQANKSKIKISGILAMAAGLWIIVDAFGKVVKAVSKYGSGPAWQAFAMIELMLISIGAITFLIGKFGGGVAGNISSAIAIIAMGITIEKIADAFGNALSKIKGIDVEVMKTFFIGVDASMAILAGAVIAFGNMPVATFLGSAGLVAVMGALAVGIGIIADVGSDAIDQFSASMWIIGSRLGDFQSMTEGVDFERINKIGGIFKDVIGPMLTEAIGLDTGTALSKALDLVTLGGRISLYYDSVKDISIDSLSSVKTLVTDAKDIADTVSSIKLAEGAEETLTGLAGALRVYYEALGSVSVGEDGTVTTVDSKTIANAFTSLKDAIPQDSIDQIRSFTEGGSNDMLSVSAGIGALGVALKAYGEDVGGISIEDIEAANSAIESVKDLDTYLKDVTWDDILGIFTGKRQTIEDFGGDMEVLGTAMSAYANSISDLDSTKIEMANGVIGVIKELNTALPKEGGFLRFITGQKDLGKFAANMSTLGDGVAGYANKVSDAKFDNINDSMMVVTRLASVFKKLDNAGGVFSWFEGDKDLSVLTKGLTKVGDNLLSFEDSVTDFDSGKVEDALNTIEQVIELQNSIDWKTTDKNGLKSLGESVRGMFNEIALLTTDEIGGGWGRESVGVMDAAITAGTNLIDNFGKGILQNSRTAISNMQTVVSHVGLSIRSYYNAFVNAGSYLTAGLGQGIYNGGKTVIGTARMLANSVRNIIGSIWKINSPSRVGYWLGEMWDAGIANGISDYASSVTGVSGDMAESTVKAAEYGLSTFSQSLIDDTNMTPVIRPVLDLSEVQAGANGIGGYFGNHVIGIGSTNLANKISSKDAVNRQAAEAGSNANLGMTIMNLNERINQLDDTISNMKVVMDSGALVGQIGPGMDRYLGRRQIMSRRGS